MGQRSNRLVPPGSGGAGTSEKPPRRAPLEERRVGAAVHVYVATAYGPQPYLENP